MRKRKSESPLIKVAVMAAIALIGLLAVLRPIEDVFTGGGSNAALPTATPVPCAANAIEISIVYMPLSPGYRYMPKVMDDFNLAYSSGANPVTGQPLAAGERPICITGTEVSSGTAMQAIVNAIIDPDNTNVQRPTLWQPAVSHWLSLANYYSGQDLFDLAEMQPIALSPVVIAIWESRLEAIRSKVGYDDIGWEELLDVMQSPNGWCDYGIENCRPAVYYGHTDPYISSTGLSTLISEFYAAARQSGFEGRVLTMREVDEQAVQDGVRAIEAMIRHYSQRTTEFKFYIARGPDYVDFVALPENDLLFINRGLTPEGIPPEPLVALYPKEGTFWHEHPFGLVHADWVMPEQTGAARVFTQYMLTPVVQEYIMSFGFRPANPAVPLASPIVEEYGIDPAGRFSTLDVPDAEVVSAIQASWSVVKKQADIMLVFDVSGSMAGERISQAQQAALAFLDNVEANNRVGLAVFSESYQTLVPLNDFEVNEANLRQAVAGLQAGGGTALYAAVRESVTQMNALDADSRIRVVVLLSDGEDTSSSITLNDALREIRASRDSLNPVIVIPVEYGENVDSLNNIALTSATNVYSGDPQSILGVMEIVSSIGG